MFVFTWLAYAAASAVRRPLSVSKSTLATDLGFSKVELGWLDTAFYLPYGIGMVYGGPLADRYGATLVLFGGMTISSIAVFIQSMCSGFYSLALGFVMLGVSQSVCWPACIKCLAAWFESSERSYIVGFWTTCQSVGGISGTVGVSFLVHKLGWREAWRIPAMLTAAAGLAAYAFVKSSPSSSTSSSSSSSSSSVADQSCHFDDIDTHNGTSDEMEIESLASLVAVSQDGHEELDQYSQDKKNKMKNGKLSDSRTFDDESTDDHYVASNKNSHSSNNASSKHSSSHSGTSSTLSPSSLPSSSSSAAASPAPATTEGRSVTFAELLAIPNVGRVTCAYLCTKTVRYSFLMWLPMYFQSCGIPIEIAAVLASSLEAGNIVCSLIQGFVIEKIFKGRKFMTAAAGCGVLFTCLIVFIITASSTLTDVSAATSAAAVISNPSSASISSPSLPAPSATPTTTVGGPLLLLLGVTMFVAGIGEPGTLISGSICADLGEEGGNVQGALSGLVNGVGTIGTVLQGPVIGFISTRFGWMYAFGMLAGLSAISIVILSGDDRNGMNTNVIGSTKPPRLTPSSPSSSSSSSALSATASASFQSYATDDYDLIPDHRSNHGNHDHDREHDRDRESYVDSMLDAFDSDIVVTGYDDNARDERGGDRDVVEGCSSGKSGGSGRGGSGSGRSGRSSGKKVMGV